MSGESESEGHLNILFSWVIRGFLALHPDHKVRMAGRFNVQPAMVDCWAAGSLLPDLATRNTMVDWMDAEAGRLTVAETITRIWGSN